MGTALFVLGLVGTSLGFWVGYMHGFCRGCEAMRDRDLAAEAKALEGGL